MAIVHDLAKALVGDITPMDEVPKIKKNRQEATAIDYFTRSLLGKVTKWDVNGSVSLLLWAFLAGILAGRIDGLWSLFPVLGGAVETCFDDATGRVTLIRWVTRAQH